MVTEPISADLVVSITATPFSRRVTMPDNGSTGLYDIFAYVFAALMILGPLSFVMHGGAMH
jgi:hypothetical protein